MMEQNISNYQSIFQLLSAIYLVAEWVSLDKISDYYQQKQRESYRHRFKSNRKYSPLIHEIFDEFEEKEWSINYPSKLHKNYSAFKSMCRWFFVLSFSALLFSSFYSTQVVAHWLAGLFIIILLIPFFWIFLALLRPAYEQHKLTVSMLEEVLVEVESTIEDYKKVNPEPTLNDAYAKREQGDDLAFRNHMNSKRKFNEQLIKYMQRKFEGV